MLILNIYEKLEKNKFYYVLNKSFVFRRGNQTILMFDPQINNQIDVLKIIKEHNWDYENIQRDEFDIGVFVSLEKL